MFVHSKQHAARALRATRFLTLKYIILIDKNLHNTQLTHSHNIKIISARLIKINSLKVKCWNHYFIVKETISIQN